MGSWVEDFSMADTVGGSHSNKRSPTKKEQIEVINNLILFINYYYYYNFFLYY